MVQSENLQNTNQKKPTISLCMIVKDEEEFLSRCLASVKDIVDEMIIVDTGSKDKTVEIAESYDAKIYHHSWQGSFSEARNYGLQFATGDWILQIDADEELEREDIPLLKEIICTDKYDAIFVALLNEVTEGWAKHYFQRIFRRGRAQYKGIVHNQLEYTGPDLVSEIRIYHYGYNLSREKMSAKFRRTEELVLKQIAEDQTNPFAHQNYVRVLRAQKRFEEGVAEGRRAMMICKNKMGPNHLQMIAFDTANCLIAINQADEAEMLARKVLKDYPNNIDILFVLGESLRMQKRYQEAVEVYQKFLKIKGKNINLNPDLIYDTYTAQHKAWACISDCYFEEGNLEKSREAIENAIKLRSDFYIYKISLVRILIENNQIEEAREILKNAYESNNLNAGFYKKWAKLCIKYPVMGSPVEKLEQGLAKYPESEELNNEFAYAVHKADPQTAKNAWQKVLELNPNHVGAHTGLAKIYGDDGRSIELEKHSRVILEKCNQKALLKVLGKYCLNSQLYSTAIDLLSKYLTIDPKDAEALSDVATCYAQTGQFEASFIGYKEALRLSPKNPEIIERIKKLQNIVQESQSVDS